MYELTGEKISKGFYSEFFEKIKDNYPVLFEQKYDEISIIDEEIATVRYCGESNEFAEKRFQRMRETNPSGAAYMANKLDQIEVKNKRESIDEALDLYREMAENIHSPEPYAGIVKILESYGLNHGEEEKEYFTSISKTCEIFSEKRDKKVELLNLLEENRYGSDSFSKRFEKFYNKVYSSAEELSRPQTFAVLYDVLKELEGQTISERGLEIIESDSDALNGIDMNKRIEDVYDKAVSNISDNIILGQRQRRWISKFTDLEPLPGRVEGKEPKVANKPVTEA